ncbi:MAG: hypothetical protein OQL06_13280 [Gammaproteobacteria bacterium]|nr:hypothetical protein [Gammaproteobacteria bacterium]
MPADRITAGKDETAIISLNTCYKVGNIVIETIDEGKGTDPGAVLGKTIIKGLVSAGDNLTNWPANQ